jgi:hypothetical protein
MDDLRGQADRNEQTRSRASRMVSTATSNASMVKRISFSV